MHLQPFEIAIRLAEIYKETFGGKKHGRFRISRCDLRELSGLCIIKQNYVDDVVDMLYQYKLMMFEVGDNNFIVTEHKAFNNYRKVPKHIIEEYKINNSNPDDDNEPV